MKKFGFHTSSITFKALCVFLPIQVIILVAGYVFVSNLIVQTKNELKDKFAIKRNSLEKTLKENPSLRLTKFSNPKNISAPNTFPIFLGTKKIRNGPDIQCMDQQVASITDRFSYVKNKFQFRVSIIGDLLVFFGGFEGYDILSKEHFLKIDFLDRNKKSSTIKTIFVAKDSDDSENQIKQIKGNFVLEKETEWSINQDRSYWKRNGADGEFVYGTFSLFLKRKEILRNIQNIRFSLHENNNILCQTSPRYKISFFLTASLQEKMNEIQKMKHGILFRDLSGNDFFKNEEYNLLPREELEKKSLLVRFGESIVGSQKAGLPSVCGKLQKILKKNLSELSMCSSLFDETVYIWSQERNWQKESLYPIYNIAAIGFIIVLLTIFLLCSLIFYLKNRLGNLQREIEKHVSSDGEILPTIEKMEGTQNDELGLLTKLLQLSFLKIRDRNTFYRKMSDFLRHELGQQFSKLRLKIANINSNPEQVEINKSLIKTLELSEKTLQDFTSASNIISALNAGKREQIDLCSFMKEFVEYFETPDSNIRLEIRTENVFAECVPIALERAFSSIFENASDFRKKGTEITCILETKDSGKRITIKNEGNLIDEKNLMNIFDLGFSIRETQTKGIHQGFGLFLVKAVIEFHGWNISANNNSEPPGVEFVIEIP